MHWRSTARELPPNDVSVLGIWLWDKANPRAGSLSHDVVWYDLGQWFDGYSAPVAAPSHWMPLPPAPASGTPTRRAETTGSVGEADGGPTAEGGDAQ
jgi:hypothetical protein